MGSLRRIQEFKLDKVEEEGERINRESWDNLIILDACRYDFYKEVTGRGDKIISKSSSTPEFIKKNFSTGDWSDVHYVSACYFLQEERFKAWTGRDLGDVFKSVVKLYKDEWNSDVGTVMPQKVFEAVKSKDVGDEERLIIHFMQPHNPFVGYEFDVEVEGDVRPSENEGKVSNIYVYGEMEEITREEIRQGYKSNLEVVMEYVEKLASILEGKTVVTADHGEMLGEEGLYGHTYGSNARVLREVPWDVLEHD